MQANKGFAHLHFPSIAAAVDSADAKMRRGDNESNRVSTMQKERQGSHWYGAGCNTARDARNVIVNGHAGATAAIDALYDAAAKNLPRAIGIRRHRIRADQGADLDIHAVFRGDLSRAWESTTRALRTGSTIVRIVADICGNAGESADALQLRGFAVMALDRILRRAGYATAIYAAQATSGSGNSSGKLLCTFTVKPSHAIVNPEIIAATVAFPGFFRTVGFAAIFRACDNEGRDVRGGYGQAMTAEGAILPDAAVSTIITPAFRNKASVETWLADQVKLLQGETVQANR